MSRLVKNRSKKAGLPPGSPVHIGDNTVNKVKITIIDYNESQFQENEVDDVKKCFPFKDTSSVTWINVEGISEVSVINRIGECFDLHPLLVEDIVNTEQRPKIEDFGDYLFLVLKMLQHDDRGKSITVEQLSLIISNKFVISFQESLTGDVFDPVRARLRENKGKLRRGGADNLAHALIDAMVDNYFIILELLGEDIELLESEIVKDPQQKTLNKIHKLKKDMIFVRRAVWPLREIIASLERGESQIIKKPTRIYFRDVYDHTIHVIDTVETFRDIISGMLDIYLSSINNRLNEIMRVLAVIATIFIPLTFLTGVYGMNFDYMPELRWFIGYPLFWVLSIVIALSMWVFFRKKRWV